MITHVIVTITLYIHQDETHVTHRIFLNTSSPPSSTHFMCKNNRLVTQHAANNNMDDDSL